MHYWASCILGLSLFTTVSPAQETQVPFTFQQRLHAYQRSLTGPGPLAKSMFTATLKQLGGDSGEWGRGSAGVTRRFTSRYGVRVAANSLEFGLGALIGEDPRYFRSEQTGLARIGHAVKSTFVAPSESGGTRFAYARMAGIFGGAALSNAWYPDRYRTVGGTLERAGFSIAGDVAGNLVREFWPDIKRKLLKRR